MTLTAPTFFARSGRDRRNRNLTTAEIEHYETIDISVRSVPFLNRMQKDSVPFDQTIENDALPNNPSIL